MTLLLLILDRYGNNTFCTLIKLVSDSRVGGVVNILRPGLLLKGT